MDTSTSDQQYPQNTENMQGDSFGVLELVRVLQSIDPHNPLASINAVTISDNNGGRIEL